jgi:RNA polymerase sigma-70 factor (ECF subfamily)
VNSAAFIRPINPPDLILLAQRIRGGDRSAERDLVQRYRKVILAMVRRRCRPGESHIEDLVHDVFTSLLQRLRLESWTELSAVTEYLCATVHHRCIAHYRCAAQRKEMAAANVPELLQPTESADALTVAMRQERCMQVRALVASLPLPRDREVLRLFYLEQRQRDEICALLQIDVEHFRRVLHRARQRMLLHLPAEQIEQLRH